MFGFESQEWRSRRDSNVGCVRAATHQIVCIPIHSDTMTDAATTDPVIYLASASPRRAELLRQIGIAFRRLVVDVPEVPKRNELAEVFVQRAALDKARAGWETLADDDPRPVLGADTAVVIDGEILGKPRDEEAVKISVSEVTFRPLSEPEIATYWATGEPADKAGGYAIQGRGAVFVERLEGSYSGVMGLPLFDGKGLLWLRQKDDFWEPARMSEELLINVTPQETRVAYVENGVLQEVHIERARRRGLVGNVYKGCCQACRRPFSRSAWNVPPSCTPTTSCRVPPSARPMASTRPPSWSCSAKGRKCWCR